MPRTCLDIELTDRIPSAQVVMCAASEDDDCVFCLLECEEVTKAGEGKEPHG